MVFQYNLPLADFNSSKFSFIFGEQDVIDIISTLNVDKAVGHDIISNRMLLAVKNEIAKPLSMLFNRSLQELVFQYYHKVQLTDG
jgi:hypothetical protein